MDPCVSCNRALIQQTVTEHHYVLARSSGANVNPTALASALQGLPMTQERSQGTALCLEDCISHPDSFSLLGRYSESLCHPYRVLLGFPGLAVMMHWGHQRAPKEFKPELIYVGLASALAGNATWAFQTLPSSSGLIAHVSLRGQWQGQYWVL